MPALKGERITQTKKQIGSAKYSWNSDITLKSVIFS